MQNLMMPCVAKLRPLPQRFNITGKAKTPAPFGTEAFVNCSRGLRLRLRVKLDDELLVDDRRDLLAGRDAELCGLDRPARLLTKRTLSRTL